MPDNLTADDRELLEHYVARGKEAWNVSLEAAWLDYQMRAYVLPRLVRAAALHAERERRPLQVCNVGIGVGLWDDWLGHLVGAPITSVDRDEAICRLLAIRQASEEHPFASRIVCGDALDGALGATRFDVITCVGSTFGEAGDAEALRGTLLAHLAPRGIVLACEVVADDTGIALVCTSIDAGGVLEPAIVARCPSTAAGAGRCSQVMMADLIRCSCTRVNDPWRRFCGGCGRKLGPSCGCGFVNARGDAFCGGCGAHTGITAQRTGLTSPIPRAPSKLPTATAPLRRAAPSSEPTTIPLDVIEVVG